MNELPVVEIPVIVVCKKCGVVYNKEVGKCPVCGSEEYRRLNVSVILSLDYPLGDVIRAMASMLKS